MSQTLSVCCTTCVPHHEICICIPPHLHTKYVWFPVYVVTFLCHARTQDDKAFLAHFWTVTSVKKTDTHTFVGVWYLTPGDRFVTQT